MTGAKLDRVLLDAAVAGVLDDDDFWADLIVTSDGHSQWESAIATRAEIDAAALAIIAHPLVARWSEVFRRGVPASWTAPIWIRGPSGATLAGHEQVSAKAGETTVVAAEIGNDVVVSGIPNTKWLWRDARGATGTLGLTGWKMEIGDAPVLLLAVLNDPQFQSDLNAAVDAGLVVAAIVLIERTTSTAN